MHGPGLVAQQLVPMIPPVLDDHQNAPGFASVPVIQPMHFHIDAEARSRMALTVSPPNPGHLPFRRLRARLPCRANILPSVHEGTIADARHWQSLSSESLTRNYDLRPRADLAGSDRGRYMVANPATGDGVRPDQSPSRLMTPAGKTNVRRRLVVSHSPVCHWPHVRPRPSAPSAIRSMICSII